MGIKPFVRPRLSPVKGNVCKFRRKNLIMIQQKEITLPGLRRGYHLITSVIEEQLPDLPEKGLLHILVKHTSAGITINENADPSVRTDFENFINKMIPEDDPVYIHTYEGSDDIT